MGGASVTGVTKVELEKTMAPQHGHHLPLRHESQHNPVQKTDSHSGTALLSTGAHEPRLLGRIRHSSHLPLKDYVPLSSPVEPTSSTVGVKGKFRRYGHRYGRLIFPVDQGAEADVQADATQ